MVWGYIKKTINPIPFRLPEKRAKLQIHLYIRIFTYDTNIKIKKSILIYKINCTLYHLRKLLQKHHRHGMYRELHLYYL